MYTFPYTNLFVYKKTYTFMDFFRRSKPAPDLDKAQRDTRRLEELVRSGATEVLIDDTGEYADLSEAISKFKATLTKPVERVETEVKKEVEAVENAVKVEVKAVENALGDSMIRVPKRVKEQLRKHRQGTESYGETIERLLSKLPDTSNGV